jgi:hypothetical protein
VSAGQGQLTLFADPVHAEHARVDQAVDSIRQRFGTAAVSRGSNIDSNPRQAE